MSKYSKRFCLTMTFACGIFVIVTGGLAGVELLVAGTISCFVGYKLADRLAKHHSQFVYSAQVASLATVIICAAGIFVVAFVNGADTVLAFPAWAWNTIVCYAGFVIGSLAGWTLTAPGYMSRAIKVARGAGFDVLWRFQI